MLCHDVGKILDHRLLVVERVDAGLNRKNPPSAGLAGYRKTRFEGWYKRGMSFVLDEVVVT